MSLINLIEDPVVLRVLLIASKEKENITNLTELEIAEFLLDGYKCGNEESAKYIDIRLEYLVEANAIENSLRNVENRHRYIYQEPDSRWPAVLEMALAMHDMEYFDTVLSFNLARMIAIRRFLEISKTGKSLMEQVEKVYGECTTLYSEIAAGSYKGDSLTSPWAVRRRMTTFINCRMNP